jgi:hypothetical protein
MKEISLKNRIHRLLYPNNIKPNWNASLNMFVALIVVLILSYLFKLNNDLTLGLVVAGIIISLVVSLNVPFKLLLRLNIITAVMIGLAFFTAALGIINIWIAFLFLLIWIFLYSILNIFGKVQATLGYIGLIIYFIASMVIVTNQIPPIQWGLWAALGALLGSMALLIPKLLQKDKSTRQILASFFIPHADVNTLIKAKMLLEKSNPSPKTTSIVELGQLLIKERSLSNRIKSDLTGAAKKIFTEFMKETDKLSSAIAEAVLKNDKTVNLNLNTLNTKIEEIKTQLELEKNISLLNALKNMENVKEIFKKVPQVIEGDLILDTLPLTFSSEISSLERIKANFNLNNMFIRHLIRFSIAVGIAFLVGLVTGSHDAFWVALTIFIVLKPDISSTYETMIIRVGATIIGVLLAIIISGILVGLGLNVVIFVLIILMLAIIVAYYGLSYSHVVVASTMLIIFLQPPENILATGLARFIDIMIGSGIAFAVAYLILPSKLKVNMPQEVVKRLESNINCIRSAIMPAIENRSNKEKTTSTLSGIILTHNNLEAGINKIINSFDDAGEDIDRYNGISESNDSLSGDLIAIYNQIDSITDSKNFLKSPLSLIENIMINLKNYVENEIELQSWPDTELSAELDEIKSNITDNESKIITEYLRWLISDLQTVYSSIKLAKDSGTLNKYKNL